VGSSWLIACIRSGDCDPYKAFGLLLHGLAHNLINLFRLQLPQPWRSAQIETVRAVYSNSVRARQTARCIRIHLGWPFQSLFRDIALALGVDVSRQRPDLVHDITLHVSARKHGAQGEASNTRCEPTAPAGTSSQETPVKEPVSTLAEWE
jgi:hypothetical protein